MKKFLLIKEILYGVILYLFTAQFVFAGYQLDKVRIYLSQNNSIDTLKVTNPDNTPTNVQAQVYAWTIKDGKDDLTPTSDIIVSPPIMRIPPNRTQLLRVGWRQPTPLATEKMFRLFIMEITPEKPLTQTGVRIRLRLGVPIFIAPANPVYQLNWSSQGLSGNKFKVKASNTGNVHVNIASADLVTDDGKTVGNFPGSTYVFPGQSADIIFNMTEVASKNLNIVAATDGQLIRSKITLP
ncbi:MAG TPA: fimbria/pilus periplasmic chaperone [Gammaproteobacteria bacterium]|jgi:fimbrial chaperone protein|nr:fimbria/pilus periplasmic chaperone [Gammaproteobacteria bacterium]